MISRFAIACVCVALVSCSKSSDVCRTPLDLYETIGAVSLDDLEAQVQALDLELRMDNFTATRNQFDHRDEFAFLFPQASYVRARLPGGRTYEERFSIDAFRSPPYTLYIDNLDLSGVQVLSRNDNELTLQLQFESSGSELVLDCVNNLVCLGGIQSFEFDSVVVEIVLEPDNSGPLLHIGRSDVEVQGAVTGAILGIVPASSLGIPERAEEALRELLLAHRDTLARVIREGLREAYGYAPGSEVRHTAVSGGAVVSTMGVMCK